MWKIIYFEWLTCAWKTSFINDFYNLYPKETLIINETIPEFYEHKWNMNDFCMNYDEEKVKLALKNKSKYKFIFVDRLYVSTLCYNFIRYKLNLQPNYYLKTLNWYINWLNTKTLLKPDAYIYIDIEPDLSIERAKKINRYLCFQDPYIWKKYYNDFFQILEPEVPLLNLNWNEDFVKNKDLFLDFIKKI